ncbi:MAG: type III pantothenate kinase [Nevskiales bacterium]|nr:type III pantothenate kinase [Nevskiales bacterium]
MILLLDIGNTRLKWARSDGRTLRDPGVAVHNGVPAAILREHVWPDVKTVWVSCVCRTVDLSALTRDLRQLTGCTPQVAQTKAEQDGLRIAYAEPQRLGVDRWLAMLACWARWRKAFCVVSAGTALTFDRVDRTGHHRGGLIAPGLTSMQHNLLSLINGRAQTTPVRAYDNRLASDTEGAIRQGAFFSAQGVIEHALGTEGSDPDEIRVITGGDAPSLLPRLGPGWDWRPQLVLEGLLALARG